MRFTSPLALLSRRVRKVLQTEQVFCKLRNSIRKLSILSGLPLLPWPPGGQARGLACLCQAGDCIVFGTHQSWGYPTTTAILTLPETPTAWITGHCLCSPCNNMRPASFPHGFQFPHLSICTLWSSLLCSFLGTLIPFTLPRALHLAVLRNWGM